MDKILKIKSLLKSKKITYEEFGKLIDKSKPTIVNYFNYKSKIDIDTLEKIAHALGVSVCYFFEESSGTNGIQVTGSKNMVNSSIQIELSRRDATIEKLQVECASLREQLKLKDEIIELLRGR